VNALEQDASEVLGLVRSLKNSLAPINRIPPEVLSLIPDYHDKRRLDQNLIALTHVCRSWRDIFTSRSSLWTKLDFTNVDKTRTYIQRSRSSPLEIHLEASTGYGDYRDDAFSLVIPHLHRLKSLTISANFLPDILRHFRYHAPLLEKLAIDINGSFNPVLDSTLFNGDLSSLRELRLGGVITHLPWNNMTNLKVLNLSSRPPGFTYNPTPRLP
jgi:hypothetical protein